MQRTLRQITNGTGLLALLGALALAACSDGTTNIVTVVHPTLVSVEPEDFLGTVPCVDGAGAMRTYVATIWDMGIEAPDDPAELGSVPRPDWFPLPSSGPIPCTQSVGFARVIPGHRYYAEIRGYDRANLVQLLPSVDVLFDAETGERVAPRWSTQCTRSLRPSNAPPSATAGMGGTAGTAGTAGMGGTSGSGLEYQYGVEARPTTTRTIHGCNPLVDAQPSDLRSVSVSLTQALGSVSCGSTDDAIERFEVQTPSGETLEAACDATLTLEDVSGTLVLPVLAYAAGADDPRYGTTCTATALNGTTVNASCLPLTDQGALRVIPSDALQALGLACDAIASLTLSRLEPSPDDPELDVVTEVRRLSAAECERSVSFSGLFRGTTARVAVDAILLDGSVPGPALCSASVVPSQTVLADCAPSP